MRPALLLLFVLLLTGCSEKTATVTGTVTLDGKPLPNATVTFFSPNQQTYSVTTDDRGEYSLDGVVCGTVRVCVQMPPPRPAPRPNPPADFRGETATDDNAKAARQPATPITPPASLLLPERYRDPELSGLQLELTGTGQRFDIPLKSQ